MLNFRTSEPYRDVYGRSFLGATEIKIWDGHINIATHKPDDWLAGVRRYERFNIPTGRNIQWGIGVSVKVYIPRVPPNDSPWWIEFGSAGAEFVSRSGLAVDPS